MDQPQQKGIGSTPQLPLSLDNLPLEWNFWEAGVKVLKTLSLSFPLSIPSASIREHYDHAAVIWSSGGTGPCP